MLTFVIVMAVPRRKAGGYDRKYAPRINKSPLVISSPSCCHSLTSFAGVNGWRGAPIRTEARPTKRSAMSRAYWRRPLPRQRAIREIRPAKRTVSVAGMIPDDYLQGSTGPSGDHLDPLASSAGCSLRRFAGRGGGTPGIRGEGADQCVGQRSVRPMLERWSFATRSTSSKWA